MQQANSQATEGVWLAEGSGRESGCVGVGVMALKVSCKGCSWTQSDDDEVSKCRVAESSGVDDAAPPTRQADDSTREAERACLVACLRASYVLPSNLEIHASASAHALVVSLGVLLSF